MKRNFVIILSLFIFLTSSAVFSGDWDEYADLDHAWDGQKTITNKEFEQVMDALQEKQKKKEEKRKRKKAKKISGGGTSLHNELNPDKEIKGIDLKFSEDEGGIVNIPVYMYIDGKKLDKGYYKVTAEKSNDGKVYLSFYQSQYLMGKVEATETEDDFEEDNVDFAKVVGYSDSFVKIIFGNINLNAYVYIPYSE